MHAHDDPTPDIRARLRELRHHLEHVLPGQAPIKDFVHHNTLHGFQHLPFSEALRQARELTGAVGYLPAERFRALYREGRIDAEDLESALRDQLGAEYDAPLFTAPDGSADTVVTLCLGEALAVAQRHALPSLSRSQLKWQVEEMGALTRLQPEVDPAARARLLAEAGDEASAASNLWSACLDVLGLEHALLHPEEILDPSSEQANALAARLSAEMGVSTQGGDGEGIANRRLRKEALERLDGLLARLGGEWTLRRLLLALTGEDLLDEVRPILARHLGAHLDQGLAAWHNPERGRGFFAAWRQSAEVDLTWLVQDLPEWWLQLERMPDDPVEVIVSEMGLLGLPEASWTGYLERLCLDLPGWSGMALWRSGRADYRDAGGVRLDMLDYLAVFLVLERLFAQRICRRHWRIEASVSGIRWHFRHQPAELLVRHALFEGKLPEYLVSFAERLVREAAKGEAESLDESWQTVAHLIWSWRQTPVVDRRGDWGVADTAWPLYRFAQLLGLPGRELRRLGEAGAVRLLSCLSRFDADQAGYVWLCAYERHYRERILAAVAANHGRAAPPVRPEAQLVFCMDDREEGIRRHLEEINPRLETLGAAAHFNVPHNWRGLDDRQVTALAPVIPAPVIPAHEVCETHREGRESQRERHDRRYARRMRWRERLLQNSRLGLLRPLLYTAAAAPATLALLAGKALAPARTGGLTGGLSRLVDGKVPTRIEFCAAADSPAATPASPRLGFTPIEQADRVQALLTNTGLTRDFADLVVIVGHGSRNQNNPHASAYNCGACAGHFSGPNARLVAAMANRPEVRVLLAERGIAIPEATCFVGAEHDTCDDRMIWYDTDLVPDALGARFVALRADLDAAGQAHASERCRRLASAPLHITPKAAWRHVAGRSNDYSQARPELGHATNACAFFGRRILTRGTFLDRRAFLISYDPTQDPEGKVLERHLLINGAVGAGISLEYYFSSVDNERYGCGSKVVHNVAGFLGVMEGTSSDLRTGLPRQMIEIHEAMRLLVIVEHRIDIITAIYQRQAVLQELIGGGWVTVVAKDPDSAAIHLFDPVRGWVPWIGGRIETPTVRCSGDWFHGHRDALSPTLLTQPLLAATGPGGD
jgi:hypothetical protein